MNKDYQIVVVSSGLPNAPYYCLNEFYKSLSGEQIIQLGGDFPNFHLSDRPRILYDAFQKGIFTAPKILFCDSWDLVFVDKPEVLFNKWEAMECDLGISGEKNCFPDDYKEQFDKTAPEWTSYKYINCGLVLGHTEAFYEALKSMDALNHPYDYWDAENNRMFHYNEQKYWHEEWLKQPVNIKIDYRQDLAWCMQDVSMDDVVFWGGGNKEIEINKIKNKETGTSPSIIHWNGSSKTNGTMEPILKHLNL